MHEWQKRGKQILNLITTTESVSETQLKEALMDFIQTYRWSSDRAITAKKMFLNLVLNSSTEGVEGFNNIIFNYLD